MAIAIQPAEMISGDASTPQHWPNTPATAQATCLSSFACESCVFASCNASREAGPLFYQKIFFLFLEEKYSEKPLSCYNMRVAATTAVAAAALGCVAAVLIFGRTTSSAGTLLQSQTYDGLYHLHRVPRKRLVRPLSDPIPAFVPSAPSREVRHLPIQGFAEHRDDVLRCARTRTDVYHLLSGRP